VELCIARCLYALSDVIRKRVIPADVKPFVQSARCAPSPAWTTPDVWQTSGVHNRYAGLCGRLWGNLIGLPSPAPLRSQNSIRRHGDLREELASACGRSSPYRIRDEATTATCGRQQRDDLASEDLHVLSELHKAALARRSGLVDQHRCHTHGRTPSVEILVDGMAGSMREPVVSKEFVVSAVEHAHLAWGVLRLSCLGSCRC